MSEDDTKPASRSEAVQSWLDRIERARTSIAMARWEKRCEKIRKKFMYEASADTKTRHYQMLWSNMETMKPAVYTKSPKAAVIRRFNDPDPTARTASTLLERCIDFTLDANEYDGTFKQVRDDYLLYARGTARIYYEPVMETVQSEEDGLDGSDVEGPQAEVQRLGQEADEGNGPEEILKFENVRIRYVQRNDFIHEPARTWDEVNWIAFRSFLDRDALVERFGEEIGKAIPLDARPDNADSEPRSNAVGTIDQKATVWEIWDRCERRVLWIAQGHTEVLEEGLPYLSFEGFYPCPKPAYGTLSNDSLEPVPDFTYYQDQVEEIDTLTARIATLTDSLKLVGFYPAGPEGEGQPSIEQAVRPGLENKMIAVKSWAAFKEGGSGGAPVVFLPVDQVIKVLEGCVKLRQQLIEDVYQIYGLSDIMRGDGNASETATAQNIKAQYGSVRIRSRQQELARFCRDVCRLVAEVVCTQFQPETIMAMANMPLKTRAQVEMEQMQAQEQALMAAQQQQQAMMAQQPPQGQLPPPGMGA
jgi:hypothetical protein